MKKTIPSILSQLTGPFVYVDCGSRGEQTKSILEIFEEATYVGFDPGLDDSAKVERNGKNHIFFPVALGGKAESKTFYRTQNPNCSSVFPPDKKFVDRFVDIGTFFDIIETTEIEVVALDEFLPVQKIDQVDFLELDVQGAEFEILLGARDFLSSSIFGLRVEVEFSRLYRSQPLFSDVDEILRKFGFVLFDIERYYLRRLDFPLDVPSREQLVWGQAIYFKNLDDLLERKKYNQALKMAMVASYFGFHSYAIEIVERLLNTNEFNNEEDREAMQAIKSHISGPSHSWLMQIMFWLNRSFLQKAFRRFGKNFLQASDVYRFVTGKQKYFWKD